MVTLVKPLQLSNAESLIVSVTTTSFTDFGTDDILSSPPKIYPKFVFPVPSALSPTKGIVIPVKLPHPPNAPDIIYFVSLLITHVVIFVFFALANNIYGLFSLPRYNALSYSLYSNAEHPSNAVLSILGTLSSNVTLFKLSQYLKACRSILVIVSGIIIFCNPLNPSKA